MADFNVDTARKQADSAQNAAVFASKTPVGALYVLTRQTLQLEGSYGKSIHRCVTLLSRRIFLAKPQMHLTKKVSQKEIIFVNLADFLYLCIRT